MLHLVLLGVLGLAGLVWAIKNRAWELSVTIELPTEKEVAPKAPADGTPSSADFIPSMPSL